MISYLYIFIGLSLSGNSGFRSYVNPDYDKLCCRESGHKYPKSGHDKISIEISFAIDLGLIVPIPIFQIKLIKIRFLVN